MSSTSKKIMVIIGVGPGNGFHVAQRFGREGYHIVMMSRSEDSLQDFANKLENDGISSSYYVVDCADPKNVKETFDRLIHDFNTIDVLHYNTASLKPGLPENLTNSDLLEQFQIDVASALICIQKVLPSMKEKDQGAILFTNGGLYSKPHKEFTALGIGKAALYNLAGSLIDDLKETDIFVGSIVITGLVKEGTEFAPEIIAEQLWKLFDEKSGHEVVIWPGKDI